MNKDIFGNEIKERKKKTKLETTLKRNDEKSFNDRLERLKYLNKIIPKDIILAGDHELIYIFEEIKTTFVNGDYIASIILSQAFIERILQGHYKSIGLAEIGRKGLKAILTHVEKHEILHPFLLKKFDILRLKRNPLVHLKPLEYEYNITQRIMKKIENSENYLHPILILEGDAKEAVSLMCLLLTTKIENPKYAT